MRDSAQASLGLEQLSLAGRSGWIGIPRRCVRRALLFAFTVDASGAERIFFARQNNFCRG